MTDQPTHTTAEGERLTQTLLAALYPYVDGLPSALVIEASAAAFWAVLMAATPGDPAARNTMLRRYIQRLEQQIT